jgi:small nuclear ribonucleoprotein E
VPDHCKAEAIMSSSYATSVSGSTSTTKVQKVMVQPINLIFRYLQNRTKVSVWLYENVNTRIEGHIVGFDEYMNLVLDDAAEVHLKKRTRKEVGRIMLKGDNITLIQSTEARNENM